MFRRDAKQASPLQARVDELEEIDRQLQDAGPDDEEREALIVRKHEVEAELAELRGEPAPETRAEAGSR